MPLMDLRTSRERLAIVEKVGKDLRHTAWVAANPQLAAEAELWREEPRRATKLNSETVMEAVFYIVDIPTLEKLGEVDRRSSIQNAVYDRISRLRAARNGVTGPVYNYANQKEQYSREMFMKEVGGVVLEEVAQFLERWAWRFNQRYMREWFDTLTDEQLDKVMTHRVAYASELLVAELMRRGRVDEVFANATDSTLIAVIARNCDITEDLYNRIRARKVNYASVRFRFTPDGIAALKRHRAFAALIHNHIITVEELATGFGDFDLQDLQEIFGSKMSEHELTVLEEPVLRYITDSGEPAPSFIVGVYNRRKIQNERLARLIALSDGPREVLNFILGLPENEVQQALEEFQTLRGDDVTTLLYYLGSVDDNSESRAILEILLTKTPLQIRGLSQIGGWVITEIMDRTTAKLEPGDWPMFFRLFESFTGTVDELLTTISAVRV